MTPTPYHPQTGTHPMTPLPLWSLSPAALLAVLPAASREERRPILAGLFLRPDGVAVATDGVILAAHRHAHTVPEPLILGDVKALAKFLKDAEKRQRKALAPVTLTRLPGEGVPLARIECEGNALTVPILGGDALNPYPNVGNVVPMEPNEGFGLPSIRFDADLLARLGGRVTCHFTGEHRAIVLTREDNLDWWGLLMPMRGVHETAPWAAVQWLRCEGPTVTAPPALDAGQEQEDAA